MIFSLSLLIKAIINIILLIFLKSLTKISKFHIKIQIINSIIKHFIIFFRSSFLFKVFNLLIPIEIQLFNVVSKESDKYGKEYNI